MRLVRFVAILGLVSLLGLACGAGGASTPEEAVSGYMNAVESGNVDDASDYVLGGIPSWKREMISQLGSMFETIETVVVGSRIMGDEAIVFVKSYLFGQVTDEEIICVLDDGVWKLRESIY